MRRSRVLRSAALGALLVAASSAPLSCGGRAKGGASAGSPDSGTGGAPVGGRGGSANASGANGVGGASGASGSGGAVGTSGTAGTAADAGVTACKGLRLPDSGTDAAANDGGEGACAGAVFSVDRFVDLLFLVDRSISMGVEIPPGRTRWEALRAAFVQIAQDPELAGLPAGIQFYGLSGTSNDAIDCNAASYATPRVGIAPLADAGDDIVAAITGHSPGGLSPILPAVQGSLTYATQWAASDVDRRAAIALVTDAHPTQCSSNSDEITKLVQAAYAGTPSVRTFVIGVGDTYSGRFDLALFARSGGTQSSQHVQDGSFVQDFVDAVRKIAESDLACDFAIPPPPAGQVLNPERVQLVYTPVDSGPEEIPKLSSSAACEEAANGGFYYDDPVRPRRIHVCPCTCSRLAAGRVELRFRCRPLLP